MQFQVPQFVEVEDKIFGPFTARQFIYIAGAGGVFFILFKLTPLWVTFLVGSPIVALGFALSFYKINNRPFISVVEAGMKFLGSSRLYLWKKQPKPVQKAGEGEEGDDIDLFVPKLSDSKLKDLAWSLDIQESVHSHREQQ